VAEEEEIGSEVVAEETDSEVAMAVAASAVAVAEEMADSLRALVLGFLRVLHLNKEPQKVQFQMNLLSRRTSEISHTTSRMPSSRNFSPRTVK